MKIVLLVLILAVISLSACADFPYEQYLRAVEPQYVAGPAADIDAVMPPKIPIGGVRPGCIIDTYTANATFPPPHDGLCITSGDDLAVWYYNASNETITLGVELTPTKRTYEDKDTGIEYSATPENIERLVGYPAEVEAGPRGYTSVPVSILIPPDVKNLPERWEFRISLVPAGQGFFETAIQTRFLITME